MKILKEAREGVNFMPPGLSKAQRSAVEMSEGPVLILAGAGTGKTRVLTERVTHILDRGLAREWEILCVTFTNKAANELASRIQYRLSFLGTFHSFGRKVLRRYGEHVNLSPNFSIADTAEQKICVKHALEDCNLDAKRFTPKYVLQYIQRLKDKGLGPDEMDESWSTVDDFRNVYTHYNDRLRAIGAVDFGDLLHLPLLLFQEHPTIGRTYQQRFRYILVDEYQDTNLVQYKLLQYLAQGYGNLCCVGDEDQSIYSWRGAELDNILRFQHDFPSATLIRLEENYRSTPTILGAAQGLIAHNRLRIGKKLYAVGSYPSPRPVHVYSTWNSTEEASLVAQLITKSTAPLGETGILVRTTAQTRELEESLLAAKIPYKIVGNVRFYEREEIRDVLSYIKTALHENDLALLRIINKPTRKIGKTTIERLRAFASSQGKNLFFALENLSAVPDLGTASQKALANFFDALQIWKSDLEQTSLKDTVQKIAVESGLLESWRKEPQRLDNFKELLRALEDFNSPEEFLDHVALMSDLNLEAERESLVSLMTLHAAKGLEFDHVLLPGWEEGLFPNQRTLDESPDNLEEERRLAYVGLTRSRKEVNILYALNRRLYGTTIPTIPSRFISELPQEYVHRLEVHHSANQIYRRFLSPGDTCQHRNLGVGIVLDVESDRARIRFETGEEKIILISFLRKIS